MNGIERVVSLDVYLAKTHVLCVLGFGGIARS